MNKKIVTIIAPIGLLLLPVLVDAQPTLTQVVTNVINAILWVVWSVAVTAIIVTFTVAGIRFFNVVGIVKEGNPSKAKGARDLLIYGIIGTVVILLAGSVVFTVRSILGV